MGTAGAVLTAVAPEAKAAGAVAAGRRRRPPAADPRVTAPGSDAARQREEIEKIKGARPPEPPAPSPAPATTTPPPASPGGGPSLPSITLTPAAQTGSGFLLGVFAWACGLAYLRGGAPEVRRFLAAKFLNKTGG